MARLNLKSAYWSVPVHSDHYKATGLAWKFKGHDSDTFLSDVCQHPQDTVAGCQTCFTTQKTSQLQLKSHLFLNSLVTPLNPPNPPLSNLFPPTPSLHSPSHFQLLHQVCGYLCGITPGSNFKGWTLTLTLQHVQIIRKRHNKQISKT